MPLVFGQNEFTKLFNQILPQTPRGDWLSALSVWCCDVRLRQQGAVIQPEAVKHGAFLLSTRKMFLQHFLQFVKLQQATQSKPRRALKSEMLKCQ